MPKKVFRTNDAAIEDVPIGSSATDYTYWSAYSLIVPPQKPGTVADVFAQFEVNAGQSGGAVQPTLPFKVMVAGYIGIGASFGGPEIPPLAPPIGEDMEAGDFHYARDRTAVMDDQTLAAAGTSWAVANTVSLVLYAASTDASDGDYLVLPAGYGELRVEVR